MADSPKRARLLAEIYLLRKEQRESIDRAVFFGWSAETKAEHDKRADRLESLFRHLANIGESN
jgi:hypothetical protein